MDSRLQQQRSDASPSPSPAAASASSSAGASPSSSSSSPTSQNQSQNQNQQHRPLLGDLARSTGSGAANPAAQAARRTFAAAAGSSSGPSSSPPKLRHHHQPRRASSSGHQAGLRNATSAVAPTAVAPATSAAAAAAAAPEAAAAASSAAAAAAAPDSSSSSNVINPPSGRPAAAAPRRHHSASPLAGVGVGGQPQPQPSSSSSLQQLQPNAHHRSASAFALGDGGSTSRGGGRTASTVAAAASASGAVSAPSSHSLRSLRLDQPPELPQQQQQQQQQGAPSSVSAAPSAVSPSSDGPTSPSSSSQPKNKGWTVVKTTSGVAGGAPPCQRSLHAAAVLNGSLYVFGGYDGTTRVNDFHAFSFPEGRWSPVLPSASSGSPPSPRDRHVALVHGNSFYVFGGFDGTSRVNDFFGFNFSSMTWRQIVPAPVPAAVGGGAGPSSPPSPRHSHSAVVHGDSMFVFGGYDGSYRADFHEFNFTTGVWSTIPTAGRAPRARYRATCVVHRNTMILFGGHDGTRHLADAHIFDFETRAWTAVLTDGTPPIPRDSHVSVVHGDSMYVFGGSTGSAMNDLLELQLPTAASRVAKWRTIDTTREGSAGHRFCHVAVTYGDSMYVFGGYDGSNRLNDFIRFDFDVDDLTCEIPPSTLVSDLRSFLHDDALSDITFIVEGQPVHAHKIMLMRCSYFRAMFLGEMIESSQSEIRLEQVRHSVFLLLLEYLYTDTIQIPLHAAMELFVAADQFGVPRLQAMCEKKMLESITVESAAAIFLAADLHSAESLRDKSLKYILSHFEAVSKTPAFEEMARGNVELVFEILRNR